MKAIKKKNARNFKLSSLLLCAVHKDNTKNKTSTTKSGGGRL